jgi:mono/diheme cytochrome c family protein
MIRSMVLGMALVVGFAAAAAAQSAGEKVYADQKCSLCHQVAGKGNKAGPLDGVGAKLKADEIRNWIMDSKGMAEKAKATRKPPMKDYSKLPKADVDALVTYLSSLK